MLPKYCLYCDKELKPKYSASSSLPIKALKDFNFERKKYCDKQCGYKARKGTAYNSHIPHKHNRTPKLCHCGVENMKHKRCKSCTKLLHNLLTNFCEQCTI